MGPAKQMKLGANKVRGANYRLMLTVWSEPISPHPHVCGKLFERVRGFHHCALASVSSRPTDPHLSPELA